MAQATFNTAHLSGNVHANLKLLERAGPIVCMDQFFDTKPHPKNSGERSHFQRAVNGTVNLNAVSEGITPASRALTYETAFIDVDEYVEVYECSSRSRDLAEYNPFVDAVPVLTDLVVNTREGLAWQAINQPTNLIFDTPAHTLSTQVNTTLSSGRIQVATRELNAQKADKWTEIKPAGLQTGSVSLEASFYCLTHTDMEPAIRALPGFAVCSDYAATKGCARNEFGRFLNVRFVTTPQLDPLLGQGAAVGSSGMISAGGVNVDLYPGIMFGKHAFGCLSIGGIDKGSKTFYGATMATLDGASKDDPGNQRAYVSARYYAGYGILNQNRVRGLMVGAPANPV